MRPRSSFSWAVIPSLAGVVSCATASDTLVDVDGVCTSRAIGGRSPHRRFSVLSSRRGRLEGAVELTGDVALDAADLAYSTVGRRNSRLFGAGIGTSVGDCRRTHREREAYRPLDDPLEAVRR